MNILYKTTPFLLFALCLVVQTPLCRAQATGGSFVCGRSIVSDIDGNIYNTVQIGGQCWMRENLRTTRYSDCTEIALGTSTSETTPYRYAVNGNEGNVPVYGYLYNWAAVMNGAGSSSANPSGVQGICPVGWHVPSDAEWQQLVDYVSSQSPYQCGGNSSYIAKALASTTDWDSNGNTCAVGNNPSSNNATGFSALPAGYYTGSYNRFGYYALFWSSTERNSDYAYRRSLAYYYANVPRSDYYKYYGHSVRCLKDIEGLPSVRTASASASSCGSDATMSAVVEYQGASPITERGICYSTSPNPTVADGKVADTGTGADYTCRISGLAEGTCYVCAYATNSAGTSYGNQLTLSIANTTVTDVDGNAYNTVQIGDQCWMKENLRTTRYSDGTPIPLGTETSTSTAYRYAPNGDESNVPAYGYLYNWKAVMRNSSSSNANPSGVQGICPAGWHVPSDAEWTQLTDYVSSQSQYLCNGSSIYIAKALADSLGWDSSGNDCAPGNNLSGNNATGFSVLPAGLYRGDYGFGYNTFLWSSTGDGNNDAYYRNLYRSDPDVARDYNDKSRGYSVRCLKDIVGFPTVRTATASATSSCGSGATFSAVVENQGSSPITERGVCYSTSTNPTVADSKVVDTGTGDDFTCLISGLSNGIYYVRAYATTSAGTSYGDQLTFTVVNTVSDVDGNVYNTVQIGNQCWMKENLRTTKYSDGSTINSGFVTSLTQPCRVAPNGDENNVPAYGYLYNWAAVMNGAGSSSANPSGVQGICPTGWHVPSDAEWKQLTDYVSSQSQYRCNGSSSNIAKALADSTGWGSVPGDCEPGDNLSGNNATGFSAVPAGLCYGQDRYQFFGEQAHFSSTTEYDSYRLHHLYLSNTSAVVTRDNHYYKHDEYSVRCLKDNEGFPAVHTATVTRSSCGSDVTVSAVVEDYGTLVITERGFCYGTSPYPTVAGNKVVHSGPDSAFFHRFTGLAANTYYVCAYATTSTGTSYGNQLKITIGVADHEGNRYNTVQIGSQCWMKENMKVTKYPDGTEIPLSTSDNTSTNTAYRYYPNNFGANARGQYGYLYNWAAVMNGAEGDFQVRGVCPAGWHVPSDAEWKQLTDYVGSQSQYRCYDSGANIAKALASSTGWGGSSSICAVGNNPESNNATGFSAVPAGWYYSGNYDLFGLNANFWSSTELTSNNAYYRNLRFNGADVTRSNYYKHFGYSVRCLRDIEGLPSVRTATATATTYCGTAPVTAAAAATATVTAIVEAQGADGIAERGVCYSTSTNPTVADSKVVDTGTGDDFTCRISGLATGIYYVRAYATNSTGTSYGNQLTFTVVNTVTDVDGNVYNLVQIGSQCWMKENLRTTKYSDGTAIDLGSSASTETAYRYYPNVSSGNVATYGYLYNWKAMMRNSSSSNANPSGVQGICPAGWHVPSDWEWTQLTNYVGSQSHYQCGESSTNIAKALASTTGWRSSSTTCAVGNDPSSNNATGFSAVPAGSYNNGHAFNFNIYADFWSSTAGNNTNSAYFHSLGYNAADVERIGYFSTTNGCSVRCLRD